MTPLPALSDVIRETLTPQVRANADVAWHHGFERNLSGREAHAEWLSTILSALLLPLTEREQGLEERVTAQIQAIRNAEVAMWQNAVAAAEARVSALTAEREALWTLAREAANGWACYAKRKVELDDIHRIHQALQALAGAPHAPTQEK